MVLCSADGIITNLNKDNRDTLRLEKLRLLTHLQNINWVCSCIFFDLFVLSES